MLLVALCDQPTCAQTITLMEPQGPGVARGAAQLLHRAPSKTVCVDKAKVLQWFPVATPTFRKGSAATCTLIWYLLLCHPELSALERCLYSALTKAGAGRGGWAQLSCSLFSLKIQFSTQQDVLVGPIVFLHLPTVKWQHLVGSRPQGKHFLGWEKDKV